MCKFWLRISSAVAKRPCDVPCRRQVCYCSILMEKMARLAIPDAVYNWINDFSSGRSYCTRFEGDTSELADILATVIQDSAIGPASFVVTASDLQPMHVANALVKFADDTLLYQRSTQTPVLVNWGMCRTRQRRIIQSWTAWSQRKSYSPHETRRQLSPLHEWMNEWMNEWIFI